MKNSTFRHARFSPTSNPGKRHTVPRAAVGLRNGGADDRWPSIVAALAMLREKGRHSVRIVDGDCGTGSLLLCAVVHARTLGFTAIEGRGIDGTPALIARARSAAKTLCEPAVGVTFEVADLVAALAEEAELPADIVLWHGKYASHDQQAVARTVAAAGSVVIVDRAHSAVHPQAMA